MPGQSEPVNLMPGEYYFGNEPVILKTLLGSCVAVTLWHPVKHIGGMCHFVLPSRGKNTGNLDGRYADEIIQIFARKVREFGTRPKDYQVYIYGGGNMFAGKKHICHDSKDGGCESYKSCLDVSCRNRQAAYAEVVKHGFTISAADIGGTEYRNVELDISTGITRVRKMDEPDSQIHSIGIAL